MLFLSEAHSSLSATVRPVSAAVAGGRGGTAEEPRGRPGAHFSAVCAWSHPWENSVGTQQWQGQGDHKDKRDEERSCTLVQAGFSAASAAAV